jgi:glycine cleavage system aminomethyltransferase T
MVQGLITNDLEGAPESTGVYAALLTAKGRMIADLRAFRRADDSIWLDLDAAARPGALEHLRKFVPPHFARIDDLGVRSGVLGIYGPRARDLVSDLLAVELRPDLAEEFFLEGEFAGAPVMLVRTE